MFRFPIFIFLFRFYCVLSFKKSIKRYLSYNSSRLSVGGMDRDWTWKVASSVFTNPYNGFYPFILRCAKVHLCVDQNVFHFFFFFHTSHSRLRFSCTFDRTFDNWSYNMTSEMVMIWNNFSFRSLCVPFAISNICIIFALADEQRAAVCMCVYL